jgi:hypothetical protein
MYKIKILTLKGCNNFLKTFHEVGDVVEIADHKLSYTKPFVKVLKHYKIDKIVRKCSNCGHETIIKKEKIVLPI